MALEALRSFSSFVVTLATVVALRKRALLFSSSSCFWHIGQSGGSYEEPPPFGFMLSFVFWLVDFAMGSALGLVLSFVFLHARVPFSEFAACGPTTEHGQRAWHWQGFKGSAMAEGCTRPCSAMSQHRKSYGET